MRRIKYKKMAMLIYFLIVVVGIITLVLITGLLLPGKRIGSRQCFYNASPEKVYNVLINNTDYGYRSDDY